MCGKGSVIAIVIMNLQTDAQLTKVNEYGQRHTCRQVKHICVQINVCACTRERTALRYNDIS